MQVQQTQLTIIHVACAALVIGCVVLSYTVLKTEPTAQQILIGLATFLWGKLGFTPAKPLQERIVQRMSPDDVDRIKSIVPPTSAG